MSDRPPSTKLAIKRYAGKNSPLSIQSSRVYLMKLKMMPLRILMLQSLGGLSAHPCEQVVCIDGIVGGEVGDYRCKR